MTSAFIFRQNVNGAFELSMRRACTRSRKNHSALNIVFLNTAQQDANVFSSSSFIENFVEHFQARRNSFASFANSDDLEFVVHA